MRVSVHRCVDQSHELNFWEISNRNFLDASSHLYKRVCPSICMSVRMSVRMSVTIEEKPPEDASDCPPGLVICILIIDPYMVFLFISKTLLVLAICLRVHLFLGSVSRGWMEYYREGVSVICTSTCPIISPYRTSSLASSFKPGPRGLKPGLKGFRPVWQSPEKLTG